MVAFRLLLLIIIGVLFPSGWAFAQDLEDEALETEEPPTPQFELVPSPLEIRFESTVTEKTNPSKESAKKRKSQWRKVCKSLGNTLKVGGGAWGSGGFTTFTCKESPSKSKKKKSSWVLTLKQSDTEIVATVHHLSDRSAEPVEFAKQQFAYSEDFLLFLEDEEFVDMIALSIMDQLPFFMSIQLRKDEADETIFRARYPRVGGSRERKFPLILPAKELTFYTLEVDEKTGLFKSRVAGTAKLERLEPTGESARRKNRGKRNAIEGYAYYKLDDQAVKSARVGRLWGHNSQGRSRKSVETSKSIGVASTKLIDSASKGNLNSLLEGGFDLLTNALLDTAASGYVGIRYGKQILAGDPLLAKTSFFGLLSEIRGGPLGGLRIYYDYLPTATNNLDGFKTSIGWSRLIFGTSLGFNPGFLFDRIDITPKIGMWSLSATLPTEQNEEGITIGVSDFKFKKQLSFGVEAGVEWQSPIYLLRTWYGFDMALSLGKYGGSAVKSNRFGLDSFVNTGPDFSVFGANLKTALLLFVIYESVELSSPQVKNSPADAGEISGITYDGGYAGLGLAISW